MDAMQNPSRECLCEGPRAKKMGAFYTDGEVARFLAAWAIKSASDRVLDPCFGGGIFLRAACDRLLQLGGDPGNQVLGVEVDREVHRRVSHAFSSEFGLQNSNLVLADFFAVVPSAEKSVDAVIGNPPFIRYQRFNGSRRQVALRRSASHGVLLPELCSSWAPFLIHSIAMLRHGGRLAMVLPMEIVHAKYAQPIWQYLRESFSTVSFLTFREKLFPDLSEDTVLMLAGNKGAGPAEFRLRDLPHARLLPRVAESEGWLRAATKIDAENLGSSGTRLIEYLIPPRARRLYRELARHAQVCRLGSFANVGIGYVTGDNRFFHLSPLEARRRAIPERFLKPAVCRGRALSGLRFTNEDWERAATNGHAAFLLHVDDDGRLPPAVARYLRSGELNGVHNAYKCRTRSPWFRVPHVYRPDAFLTYMSGASPRLVVNAARVYAPNTLHILRLHPLATVCSDALSALWQTSLTRLSVEIEGHALGGGMLKLEPSEAKNVLVAFPDPAKFAKLGQLAEELDSMGRAGENGAVQSRADDVILKEMIGLTANDCQILRSAAIELSQRRGYGEQHDGVG